jgi:hypothetical protein
MMLRTAVSLAAILLVAGAAGAAELKSGPQVGEGLNGKFLLDCSNGNYAGKQICPV